MSRAVRKEHLPEIEFKLCQNCGGKYYKNPRDSFRQWSERQFCSISCNKEFSLVPLHERYWQYANPTDNNSCWNWSGTKTTGGYGILGYKDRKLKAHRVGYELRFGVIEDGIFVCHICDNPQCVNPNHLFLGTARDNARDMARKGRINPVSILNLRPGAKGVLGAGPKSNKEIQNGR